ncbi:phage protein GemA/Gp16 family protein [Enterobacter asburiae]|uniref:phage protein GemA/Gp16 family protein n=1 Tax=Enterobacter asburiae TaxID=61645 RepID=UPI001E2CE966|nr:regulatory protein GemA [Enterobacter asburiae]MCE2004065.1 regulatory protein GemA [Enterobacter asburiae]
MKLNLMRIIHTGKSCLGWDDETYRDVLARQTGKRSSRDCTITELEKMVFYMRTQGFAPSSRGRRPRLAVSNKVMQIVDARHHGRGKLIPELTEHLTPLVREIIDIIGFDATVRLVERFGGARIPLSRGEREHGEKYINILMEVISREDIDKLCHYFGDEVYIARQICCPA